MTKRASQPCPLGPPAMTRGRRALTRKARKVAPRRPRCLTAHRTAKSPFGSKTAQPYATSAGSRRCEDTPPPAPSTYGSDCAMAAPSCSARSRASPPPCAARPLRRSSAGAVRRGRLSPPAWRQVINLVMLFLLGGGDGTPAPGDHRTPMAKGNAGWFTPRTPRSARPRPCTTSSSAIWRCQRSGRR